MFSENLHKIYIVFLSPPTPPSPTWSHFCVKGGNSESMFDVQKAAGTIIIAKPLDAEQCSFYNLTVQATDGTNTAYTQVLHIFLPFEFLTAYSFFKSAIWYHSARMCVSYNSIGYNGFSPYADITDTVNSLQLYVDATQRPNGRHRSKTDISVRK